MLDPLIRELAALFAEVNVIEDPTTRATVWADKADGILEVYAPRELISKKSLAHLRHTWEGWPVGNRQDA